LSITYDLAGIHVQPDPWYIKYSASGRELGTVPVPAAGNTIIQQEITRVRLNVRALSMDLHTIS
jgi:hypothetical protein